MCTAATRMTRAPRVKEIFQRTPPFLDSVRKNFVEATFEMEMFLGTSGSGVASALAVVLTLDGVSE